MKKENTTSVRWSLLFGLEARGGGGGPPAAGRCELWGSVLTEARGFGEGVERGTGIDEPLVARTCCYGDTM